MSMDPPPPPPPPPPAGASPTGYSAGQAWSYGWNKFTKHFGQIMLAVLVLVVVMFVLEGIGFFVTRAVSCDPTATLTDNGIKVDTCNRGFFSAGNIVSWLFGLLAWIVSFVISAGLVRGALTIVDGRDLDPKTLLTPHRLPEVIVASILTSIATFIGLVLCIIPGLIISFLLSYTLYFLMDRDDMSVGDAIRASFEFTTKNLGSVVLWFLLSLVTAFVGALLCGIGLLVAIPVVLIGTAYTYRTLSGRPVAP
ncbi:MAG: hypothetical protein QM714_02585 [Nocardioides sp.]|uniref:hypothetical protein n=1 Tax=Nocardioides sp. TaxID=35761 RepID=UPI0039E34A72